MRILVGANNFLGDRWGGGTRVAWDACRYLVSHGHEVALLCEGVENKPECERVDDVLILRYRVSKYDFNFLNRHQIAGYKVLRRQLSDWTPDLLWGHMPFQAVSMIKAFPEVKVTYTVHSPIALEILESKPKFGGLLNLKSQAGGRIERWCCERAVIITVLSRYTQSELIKLHGPGLADRIRITPGWTDVKKFRPASSRQTAKRELAWPEDRHVLFSLRRLVHRMGLDRLIAAAALVRQQGFSFQVYIGGTGPLRETLQQQIEDLQLSDCVQLVGAVSEGQLSLMYGAADAFVIPTTALECFGLIAVEAMSAGTPVLSTPVGALPEIIGRIEPGWLAQDNSAQSISDLICNFLRGDLPIHDAAEIRQFVESNYSQENALEKYVRTAIGESDCSTSMRTCSR
jgi:glycosyltransferase involved in cell wall biosynthesis